MGGHNFIDITGMNFGRWKIVSRFENKSKGRVMWKCVCECGTEKVVIGSTLLQGESKSCGCMHKEILKEKIKTHGLSNTHPNYSIWLGMRHRCNNPQSYNFKHYGGRGIKVCERWDNFETFINDIGERPSKDHSLDRIDVDGNYEPSNCRWATKSEQGRNKRPRLSNGSGSNGVTFHEQTGKWRVRIGVDGKNKTIGRYDTLEEAIQSRLDAEKMYWKSS